MSSVLSNHLHVCDLRRKAALMRLASGHLARRTATQIKQSFEV